MLFDRARCNEQDTRVCEVETDELAIVLLYYCSSVVVSKVFVDYRLSDVQQVSILDAIR